MDERDIVAATLAAGLLRPLPERASGADAAEGDRVEARRVAHAISLYRRLLAALPAG
jgi:hypothetical protein